MKLLITGVAGFIGSHLAARALAAGHQVTGLDCLDELLYGAEPKRAHLAALEGPGFRWELGDVTELDRVTRLAQGQDVVVHLAALAGVRPSILYPGRYMRVNVEGTATVLEACRRAGVGRLVFASSSSVYGGAAQPPFQESDACVAPASPYAASKRAGELLGRLSCDLHGIGVTALRFFTVYGPRQRPEMAIAKFTRLIAAGQPVPLYGDGSSARDYTFIDDIIDGTMAAIAAVRSGAWAIYNLGGAHVTTLGRLIELIAAALGETPRLSRLPDQPGDVGLTSADVSRAARELGYAPKVALEDGIQRYVRWFRELRPIA